MATATAVSNLHSDSLPLIDLRFLSLSELLSLSLSSSSSLSLQNDADLSTPKIDRSVFNESAGSRKQTFSRLRLAPPRNNYSQFASASSSIQLQNQNNATEQESAQIVSLLKSFFGSESEDIDENDDNAFVPVPLLYTDEFCLKKAEDCTESGTKKRKRGRPRKDERNLGIGSRNKGIVVVNKREGIESAEDPYGEELRRRTEGMQTDRELVGYLEGVEGEWVGNRKKSKVVNTAEFGGVLPVGWKIIISVKRRGGYAWLSCKRYISPNGQQFVSCKEVSSYLLSLSGLQGASLTDSGHKDSGFLLTPNSTPVNAADSFVKDDKNVDEPVDGSALAISASSVKVEKQTSLLKVGSSTEVPGGKKYKCHKCTTTFDEPDDLLQHLQLSHQRVPKKLRHATSMTEEAIMIDGKYQCQLCHKFFEERHRFNGHLGNHIKDYLKRLDASGGVIKSQKKSTPTSAGVRSSDSMIQPIDSNDLKISGVQYSEIKPTTFAKIYEGKLGREFSVGNDALEVVNEARNAVPAKIDVFPGAEPALWSDKCNTVLKPSDETKVLKCTVDGTNNAGRQVSTQSSSHGASTDQACIVYKSLNQISTDLMVGLNLEKAPVSSFDAPAALQKTPGDCNFSVEAKVLKCTVDGSNDIGGQGSSQSSSLSASRYQAGAVNLNQMSIDLVTDHNLEKAYASSSNAQEAMQKSLGNCKVEDVHQSSKMGTVEIYGNLVREESLITGHDNSSNLGDNDVIGIKKRKKIIAPSCNNQRDLIVNNSNSLLPSTMGETSHERGSEGGSLSSNEAKTDICRSNVINVSNGALNESKFDELGKSGINDQSIEYGANSTVTVEEVVTSKEEQSYGNCSAVASTDHTTDDDNNTHGSFKSTGNLPCPEKGTENIRLNLSSGKQALGFKTDILKVHNATEVHSQNSFPSSENEFSCGNAFDSRSENNIQLHNSSSVWLVQSSNSQIFPPTNCGKYNRNPVEKLTPYRKPDSSLHKPSCYKQTHYDENSANDTRTESYRHNETGRYCNSESHLGFGHGGTKIESNISFGAAQESNSKNYPLFPPGYQPTVHTGHHLTAPYSSSMLAQKQTRNSTEGSLLVSGKEQPQIVENNLNWDFSGGNRVEPRLEDSKFSRKNEALYGFNNQVLSNEQTMLDYMWRNDDENDLLRGFVDTSSHVAQTAGGIPACDVMSDKGESAFSVEKFDGTLAFEGLRSGGIGNMEFNFLNS